MSPIRLSPVILVEYLETSSFYCAAMPPIFPGAEENGATGQGSREGHARDLVERSFAARDRAPAPTTGEKEHASHHRGISNLPSTTPYKVVYVNGIRTSETHAQASANLVRATLGVAEEDLTVVYNPSENTAESGLKILRGSLSSSLGNTSEQQTADILHDIVKTALLAEDYRLCVVGHSHGSLIVQNVLDRLHDEFQGSPELKHLWRTRSPHIQVILYAPIVETLVPGPEAVSFIHAYDIPTRGLSKVQRAVTSAKHLAGYREHQTIRTVVYQPDLDRMGDILSDPTMVHHSMRLILDSPNLHFTLLAEDPTTKKLDPELFATNLATSILQGKRADILHYELISMGCENFGSDFVAPFLAFKTSDSSRSIRFGKFVISEDLLGELEQSSERLPDNGPEARSLVDMLQVPQIRDLISRFWPPRR